jgi:hypothetical protein
VDNTTSLRYDYIQYSAANRTVGVDLSCAQPAIELHEWKNIRTRDLELRLAAMDADETFLFDL